MINDIQIRHLRGLVEERIIPLIKKNYVLLDFHNFGNIGDYLIWKGQLEFLRKVPYCQLYSSNYYTFQADKVPSGATILLSGGGNFGDIYPACQIFRVDLIRHFPDNRIIIFPQSVFYHDTETLRKQAEALNAHPDLHICVRDFRSFNLLSQFLSADKLYLLPDMAFFLDIEIPQPISRTGKNLLLQRTDIEQGRFSSPGLELNGSMEKSDWPNYQCHHLRKRIQYYLDVLEFKVSSSLSGTPVLSKLVDPMYGLKFSYDYEKSIKKGIAFFSAYDSIISTRLHGIILAILMDKPVYILDNSYGKCSDFYDTWLTSFRQVHKIDLVS